MSAEAPVALRASLGCLTTSSLRPSRIKQRLQSVWNHRSMRIFRHYYSGLGSCLLYHRVTADKKAPEFSPYDSLTVTRECFEEQVRYLSNNYNVISLPDAVRLLKEGILDRDSLVITFDDGYRDNFSTALPILEKYSLPATVYVSTGLVDRTAELWWFEQEFIVRNSNRLVFEMGGKEVELDLTTQDAKWTGIKFLNDLFKRFTLREQRALMAKLREQCESRYSYDHEVLTWDELREFDRHPLITIGAHTVNHPILSRLDEVELYSELRDSKKRLEEMLGHPVTHFAYPFGGKDEVGTREIDAAAASGYESAVTTRHGHLYGQHNRYLFNLPRISVNYDDCVESLQWKLSGISAVLRRHGKRIIVS